MACEAEARAEERAWPGACERLDLNPRLQSRIQEFSNGKEPNRSINLMKQFNMVLQGKAQSSQDLLLLDATPLSMV